VFHTITRDNSAQLQTGVQHKFAALQHLATNGRVECFVQIMEQSLPLISNYPDNKNNKKIQKSSLIVTLEADLSL
jgi:hypothetical protein